MEKGRNCSLEYILQKDWTKKSKKLEEEVIYIVGGLYGNRYALEIINKMAQDENAKVVFNGDMHWFDVEKEDFLKIEELSKNSIKLLGNVEFELLNNTSSLGCGCNYPEDVSDGVVERSNIIHNMMKENIKGDQILNDIKKRSKTLVLDFFDKKIAITHGDEKSMSGWGCSNDNLKLESRKQELDNWFKENDIDILATTHTCSPVIYDNGRNIVINNGAAGMANIQDQTFGLFTRIARSKHEKAIISQEIGELFVELVKVDFDIEKFKLWFGKIWRDDSPASISYKNRIINGTSLTIEDIIV